MRMDSDDVERVQPPPGGFVPLGDPDVAEVVGQAAGTLQELTTKLYRTRLEDVGADWHRRLEEVADTVAGLRASLNVRDASA